MTERLKRCPFCGGEAKTMPTSGVFEDERFWLVLCPKCYAKSRDFVTKAEAAVAWNRRADEEEEE